MNFSDEFLEQMHSYKTELDVNMLENDYVENGMLNKAISVDEVEKVSAKLKNRKATGPDLMPNEVLKFKGITLILYHLFNAGFSSRFIPSDWLNALIKAILKVCKKTDASL